MFREESSTLYLSYFDDSGSDPASDLCVFGGVVIPGDMFGHAEALSQVVVNHTGISEERFNEFKAGELYFANGQFDGCDGGKCREAFLLLLNSLVVNRYPYIYSAVKRRVLENEPLTGSAHPVDVAFRMCLAQLEQWARAQHDHPNGIMTVSYEDMCVVITDVSDKELGKQLLKTFRHKRRKRVAYSSLTAERYWHIHDSMYFGDSVDSVGLQMADVASWTMRRYLLGLKTEQRMFDQLLKAAVCATPEPEWSERRHMFMSHDEVSTSSTSQTRVEASERTSRGADHQ